ncbi:hypothetical protein BRC65_02890 [Halobacteriales archaeon QH_2_65_14]|nr:MAG: hypothetical protein BRC65_02890 [Halobacteriales archaeon QH_2_65_14]
MSDFDKEAERERLREKYEHDRQKREATEKMSELLLQGATMTNAHCSDCGDPVFRYDGQEFCATCEKPIDRKTGDASTDEAADDGDDSDGDPSSGPIEVTSPSDDARVAFGSGETGATREEDDGRARDTPERATTDRPEQAAEDEMADAGTADGRRTRGHHQADRTASDVGGRRARREPGHQGQGAPDGDVGAARDALVRTLRRFSEQAEASDDPQRAREHLAAAREAAEALAALRR